MTLVTRTCHSRACSDGPLVWSTLARKGLSHEVRWTTLACEGSMDWRRLEDGAWAGSPSLAMDRRSAFSVTRTNGSANPRCEDCQTRSLRGSASRTMVSGRTIYALKNCPDLPSHARARRPRSRTDLRDARHTLAYEDKIWKRHSRPTCPAAHLLA